MPSAVVRSMFPPPENADANGVVAISRQITCAMLADAYTHGIFPWPFAENEVVPWMCPLARGIIEVDKFHIPKSLVREMKKFPFILKVDHDFNAVINACARVSRPEQEGTWIGKIFCGESMFYHISGASKFAFVKMAEMLDTMGVKIIDTQMVTGATAAFGAHEIPAEEYLKLLGIYGGGPLDFSVLRG